MCSTVADVGTDQTSYTVHEDIGQLEVWIGITCGQKAPCQECDIEVVTTNGSAMGKFEINLYLFRPCRIVIYTTCFLVAPEDYTALSWIVTLDSVTTSVHLMIPINDDNLCEPDESFEIVLTSLNDNCVVTSSPVLVLITDNDGISPVNNPLLGYMFDAYCVCVFYSCEC